MYISELEELREVIKRERRRKMTHGILLQHDNARPHVSDKTNDAIRRLGFECLSHPPYSPDLAWSDYWLFEEMKRPLRGKRFSEFKDLEQTVNHWVKGTPPYFFAIGIDKLSERWERLKKLKEEYIKHFDQEFE